MTWAAATSLAFEYRKEFKKSDITKFCLLARRSSAEHWRKDGCLGTRCNAPNVGQNTGPRQPGWPVAGVGPAFIGPGRTEEICCLALPSKERSCACRNPANLTVHVMADSKRAALWSRKDRLCDVSDRNIVQLLYGSSPPIVVKSCVSRSLRLA